MGKTEEHLVSLENLGAWELKGNYILESLYS